MKNINFYLTIANMAVMVLLILVIALQTKSSGLSNVFGGAGQVVATRRGLEKYLFYSTIVFGVIFVGLSISLLVLK